MKSNKTTTIQIHIGDTTKKVLKFGIIGFILFNILIYGAVYLDTQVAKTEVTHTHEPIDNPYEFDRNCYIDEVYYYGDDKENVTTAAKLLYERTGVQFYYFYLDIIPTEADSDAYVRAFVDAYIEATVKDIDYALIYIQTNSKVIGYDENGYEKRVGNLNEHYIGKYADDFFDSEGETLYLEYFDMYNCEWNLDDLQKCFDKTTDDLLNYEANQLKSTIKTIVISVLVIGGIAGVIAYKLYRKRVEDTIRILNTPIDDLAEDLAEEYLKDEQKT